MPEHSLGDQLRNIIKSVEVRLEKTTDTEAGRKPYAGKWSKKEVIGHLVDSAINNQGRFITSQINEDMIFTGYDQEFWVQTQNYESYHWPQLIQLWKSLNLHLARIIDKIPLETLNRQRKNHNLDKIAWKPVDSSDSTTLWYFIQDYTHHLEHHLKQVFPDYLPSRDP